MRGEKWRGHHLLHIIRVPTLALAAGEMAYIANTT